MSKEYNINEIEFEKDSIPTTKLLTGEYLKGLSPNSPLQPNTEVEKGEYLKTPDNEVVQAQEADHENGGVKVAIPDGTTMISNHLKPTKKQIREIEKSYGISVAPNDTYAKVVEKYTKKIGLEKLNNEQEELFKAIKAEQKKDVPQNTAQLNLEFLAGKVKSIEDKKKPLQEDRQKFFDYVYNLQEATKPKSEAQPTMKLGGEFETTAAKYGLTPEQALAILKQQNIQLPTRDKGGEQGDEPGRKESDLTEEEKKIIKEKWGGKTKDYLEFINTKEAILNNEELKNDIFNQYQKDIETDDVYTAKRQDLKSKYQPDLKSLGKDDVINELLAFEERNARLKALGFEASKTDQNATGKTKVTNKQAEEFISKNPQLKDLDFSKGYRGQAAYISYVNTLTQNDKYKDQRLGEFQQGVGDETIMGRKGQISGIDNYNTNTTLGQRLNYNWKPQKKQTEPGTPKEEDKTVQTYVGEGKSVTDKAKDSLPPPQKPARWFYTPDQTPLPPTPLEAVTLGDIRLGRIDPVRVGIDTQLNEIEGQKRFIAQQLEGMPETQKASSIAMMLANSEKGINQAATQANQINAQNEASAELFNIGQADKEVIYGLNNLLNYEQRTLLGKAKTEEQLRGFYDQLRKVNITNFQNNQKLNLLDSMFPQYSLDFSGSRVNFDPDNPNQQVIRDSFVQTLPFLLNNSQG